MDSNWIFVDTQKKMQRAETDFSKTGMLSIDTEYDSFRYFREKLCLIQIKANSTSYIFDPLDKLDLSFLGRYFRDRKILKILHAADNDIRLLKRDYSFTFENIFDTHRAAFLLGFQQLSLEKMINHFLSMELKKSKKMQRSRWDNRPLTDEQLHYAVQDVDFLPLLYAEQSAALRNNGLREIAKASFIKIAQSNWRERTIDRHGHTKIHGYYDLNTQEKEILKKLYSWRFRRAKEENRAIFMFLSDNSLLDLVQKKKTVEEALPKEKVKAYRPEVELILSAH